MNNTPFLAFFQLHHGVSDKHQVLLGLGGLLLSGLGVLLQLVAGLVSPVGFLLRHLKGLQVVGNNPQLFFQLNDLVLTDIGALLSLLKVALAGGQLIMRIN